MAPPPRFELFVLKSPTARMTAALRFASFFEAIETVPPESPLAD